MPTNCPTLPDKVVRSTWWQYHGYDNVCTSFNLFDWLHLEFRFRLKIVDIPGGKCDSSVNWICSDDFLHATLTISHQTNIKHHPPHPNSNESGSRVHLNATFLSIGPNLDCTCIRQPQTFTRLWSASVKILKITTNQLVNIWQINMPSPAKQTSLSHRLSLDTAVPSDQPTWPDRPSVSPITPTSSQGQDHQPQVATDDDNSSQILSLDENPDAIALRNAISILQIQRQQSIKDIQTLDRLKNAALQDPQGFLANLKDNKLSQPARPGLDIDAQDSSTSKFPPIPTPQNIVRSPPINWDKYHVVGPSLDKLHAQQQRFPGITDAQIQRSGHPPKHVIAAPYRPGIDRLDEKK